MSREGCASILNGRVGSGRELSKLTDSSFLHLCNSWTKNGRKHPRLRLALVESDGSQFGREWIQWENWKDIRHGVVGEYDPIPQLFEWGNSPLAPQEKNMSLLDLSHNKLTGDVSGFKDFPALNNSVPSPESKKPDDERTLSLTVNRLSGDLSNSFDFYSTLDILSGNLFSCEKVPRNDKNAE